MAETSDAAARIDRALGRIEAAAARRRDDGARLARRHAALREAMAEAVAALDGVIVQGPAAAQTDAEQVD